MTNLFAAAVMEEAVQGSAVVSYDLDKMSEAANYINNEYTTLGNSVQYASDEFEGYISPSDGTAIKTPAAAQNILGTWDSAIDTKLNEFITNFNSWSEVAAIVQATANDYAEETTSTYEDDDSIDPAVEGTIAGLEASLGLESRERVEDVISADTRYTQTTWEQAMAGLTEQERNAVTERNIETASSLQSTYERMQTMDTSSSDYYTILKTIRDQNPEVIAILEASYNSSEVK